MKRLLSLLAIVLLSLFLTACDENEPTSEPATSAPRIPTATPEEVEAAPVDEAASSSEEAAAPLVTNTPFVRSTLPPVQSLSVASATPRPTRTLAATSTPQPRATSNLLIDVTPVDMLPTNTPLASPQLQLSYEDISFRAQNYPIPNTDDTVVVNSQNLLWNDGDIIYTYDVIPANGLAPINVRATVDLRYERSIGRVFVLFVTVSPSDNTNATYPGPSALILQEQLQDALDNLLITRVRESGQGDVFGVSNFNATAEGLQFEIVLP